MTQRQFEKALYKLKKFQSITYSYCHVKHGKPLNLGSVFVHHADDCSYFETFESALFHFEQESLDAPK